MTFAKFVMRTIDYLFDPQQNPRKLMKLYTPGVVTETDIVFDQQYPDYKLDTYYVPREDGSKYPVVFEIHGGGFSAGDKKYRRCLCNWFAHEAGAFVVNVNYGLGSQSVYPEPVKHLVAALNWVVANADKYNLDLDRMLVTGDSAGGYYSAYLCAMQDSEKLQEVCGKMNGRFAAAVVNCGIYDIPQALQQKVLFNLTNGVCRDFAGTTPDHLNEYEYLEYVSTSDYITASFPPCLVVYAEQDFFCGGQHTKLMELLDKYGIYYESYGSTEFKDNHTFSLTWKSKAAQEANAKIIDFVKRFCEGKLVSEK